jgi:DNA-binding transcriptional ArsR family regulator
MDDELTLQSPEQFKALGHPVRHRMINLLRQRPATLRQLTAALGLTKGTIGYHVRVLREAGLIELVDSRQVRGGTEQYFALVAGAFRLAEDAGAGPEFLINAALGEMLPERPGHPEHTLLRHIWLSPQQAADLAAQLRGYASAPAGTDGGEPYGLLISLYRADIPKLKE